ncbi:hypothetical protein KC345_g255 [Hortaea werneckii]|nr:hypothetical protein KC345_g255 [Hortaea werneckii]
MPLTFCASVASLSGAFVATSSSAMIICVGVVSNTGRRVGSDARAGCGGGAASFWRTPMIYTFMPGPQMIDLLRTQQQRLLEDIETSVIPSRAFSGKWTVIRTAVLVLAHSDCWALVSNIGCHRLGNQSICNERAHALLEVRLAMSETKRDEM